MSSELTLTILERLGFYQPLDYDYKRFEALRRWCESPIEVAFWNIGYFELSKLGDFIPQVEIGSYRIDFALTDRQTFPSFKIAIELDGHDYHKTKAQRDYDTKRDRYLIKSDWQIIRFTGSQIWQDTAACVMEVVELVYTRKGLSNGNSRD